MRIFADEGECRRCSDCVGCDHHWLDSSFPPCETDNPNYRQDVQDWWEMEGKFESECPVFWDCKHCNAWTPDDPEGDFDYGYECDENKCTCLESNEDVLSVIYDPNGNALSHGEIVARLNEVPELQHEACVLSDRYASMERRANELREALEKIEKIEGCECDEYHGHKCLMCKVRDIARNAVAPF